MQSRQRILMLTLQTVRSDRAGALFRVVVPVTAEGITRPGMVVDRDMVMYLQVVEGEEVMQQEATEEIPVGKTGVFL